MSSSRHRDGSRHPERGEGSPLITLSYWRGLLVAAGPEHLIQPHFKFDARTNQWVAEASDYRHIIERYTAQNVTVVDHAKAYDPISMQMSESLVPRLEQTSSLTAWIEAKGRGVVSLPTGGGKTVMAMMAMAKVQRSTLIVVPTIDLVRQWQSEILRWLGIEAGMLGGGEKNIQPITVSTYDSALIHLDRLGNCFGMLIVDECHHLAAAQHQLIARGTIAPFRLGLSATIERTDGGEQIIYELMGDQVFDADIRDMAGDTLAPYSVKKVVVELNEQERIDYNSSRQAYLDFIRKFRIHLGHPRGWQEFLIKAARLPGGQEALNGHGRQKTIAQKASAKLTAIWDIVCNHEGERIIVFTNDNDHAYSLGEQLVAPVLTHHTKPAERGRMLDSFRRGEIKLLITSKVLNEGVDVPEASVAIVASGSGAVREHVQRLGRILRSRPGKQAMLYEVLADNTSEIDVNKRRRGHHAYQSSPAISP